MPAPAVHFNINKLKLRNNSHGDTKHRLSTLVAGLFFPARVHTLLLPSPPRVECTPHPLGVELRSVTGRSRLWLHVGAPETGCETRLLLAA